MCNVWLRPHLLGKGMFKFQSADWLPHRLRLPSRTQNSQTAKSGFLLIPSNCLAPRWYGNYHVTRSLVLWNYRQNYLYYITWHKAICPIQGFFHKFLLISTFVRAAVYRLHHQGLQSNMVREPFQAAPCLKESSVSCQRCAVELRGKEFHSFLNFSTSGENPIAGGR